MFVRKKETERIEKENHAFAKRLFDKNAVMNKRSLDKEWRNHVQYKKQIQKMPAQGGPPKTRLVVTSDIRKSNPALDQEASVSAPAERVEQQPTAVVEEKKDESMPEPEKKEEAPQ